MLFCCELLETIPGCLFFGLNRPNEKQPMEWIILQQRSEFDSFCYVSKLFDFVLKEDVKESVFGTEQRSYCVEKWIPF